MGRLSGRVVGVVILSIDVDKANPDRLLIRVRTVDDVLAGSLPDEHAFVDPELAISYLGTWLEQWTAGDLDEDQQ